MSGTVLLVTWDGAGNVPPEFALCRALVDAGHEVHVLTHDSLQERAEELGAIFPHPQWASSPMKISEPPDYPCWPRHRHGRIDFWNPNALFSDGARPASRG